MKTKLPTCTHGSNLIITLSHVILGTDEVTTYDVSPEGKLSKLYLSQPSWSRCSPSFSTTTIRLSYLICELNSTIDLDL